MRRRRAPLTPGRECTPIERVEIPLNAPSLALRTAALVLASLAPGCQGTPADAPSRDAETDVPAVPADAAGSSAGDVAAPDAEPDTAAQTLTYRAGPWTLPPGGERAADCESWTLHNEEPLYLNVVEMEATLGMHHSNWFFVPESRYPGPDGTWRCSERNFEQGVASYLGGVFFAQSTQVQREAQRFPPGTVVVIPPRSRIIGALHMLNASPQPREISLSLTARTIPRSQVRTRLAPFYLEYGPLEITPRGRSQFDVECPVDERAMRLTGAPFAARFYYGLAHYHELGHRMRVSVVGGAADGRTLYETTSQQGDSWARTMDPPIDVTGARALRLSCVFDNPRSSTVRYGIGDQEMCIWFGFTDNAYQWAGRAPQSARAMVQRETRDGVNYNTAPCTELFSLLAMHNNQ